MGGQRGTAVRAVWLYKALSPSRHGRGIGIISGAEAIDTRGRPHSSSASNKALLYNGGRATYVYSGSRCHAVFSSFFFFELQPHSLKNVKKK